jgi:hypothetical protein
LFEEAAADALCRRPRFVPEDLWIMFRLAQRRCDPTTATLFGSLFDIWHDAIKPGLRPRRMLPDRLKECDALFDRRAHLLPGERDAASTRVAAIAPVAQEIAARGSEAKPAGDLLGVTCFLLLGVVRQRAACGRAGLLPRFSIGATSHLTLKIQQLHPRIPRKTALISLLDRTRRLRDTWPCATSF